MKNKFFPENPVTWAKMKKINLIRFIDRYQHENGWPPTVREIQAEFNMSSTSVSVYWINKLINSGELERVPGVARGLRITQKGLMQK